MRRLWGPTSVLTLLLVLPACQSARLGGAPARPVVAAAPQPAPTYNAPTMIEPVPAAPAGVVTSEPLAPLPGARTAAVDPGVPPATGPIIEDAPPPAPAPPAAEPPRPQVAAVAGPSRSSVLGGWTAKDATGSTCRVTLSSTPALDLYRASAAGCPNRDLARVTAWDYRDGEVYLYQPGGAVAARLRSSGGALDGALAKSGAPLSLAR